MSATLKHNLLYNSKVSYVVRKKYKIVLKLAPPKCEQVQLYKWREVLLKWSMHAEQASG